MEQNHSLETDGRSGNQEHFPAFYETQRLTAVSEGAHD
jgi:hypothetical protein